MKVSIVDAVAQIKRSVAEALSADSIEAACRTVQHSWRKRELDPPKTVWTFLTQVLHGNTACEHAVTLSSLSCSASAYCQARSRDPAPGVNRLPGARTGRVGATPGRDHPDGP